jgi:hypothetical protein
MAPCARDLYDDLPPDRGAELRRRNLERLAELEAQTPARRARLARAARALGAAEADAADRARPG